LYEQSKNKKKIIWG